jgi:putative endonuclease
MNRALRSERGRKAHRAGHRNEYFALIHLICKGYRILGFRLKTPQGEVDILALKGRRLALVEVKSRRTVEEAMESVGPTQQYRLWQAGQVLQARRPVLKHFDLNLDLYVIVPGKWPRHIHNAFEQKS